jgi:hypothetical protein
VKQKIIKANAKHLKIPRKKKKIPSWLGFVIIGISTVLFFGGAFVYQYFAIKSNLKIESQIVQENSWKKYTDEQLGISFKYPSILGNYQKDDSLYGATYWKAQTQSLSLYSQSVPKTVVTINDLVDIFNNLKNTQEAKSEEFINLDKILVDGKEAVKVSSKLKGQDVYNITVGIPYRNDAILIKYKYSDIKDESQLDKMLYTFKFIIPSSQLVKLTYGNEKKEISNMLSRGEIDVDLFSPPTEATAILNISCPKGVTGSGIKYTEWADTVCNKKIEPLSSALEFRNSTNQIQTVTINYSINTSDGKKYDQSMQFTVQPEDKKR